MSAATFTCPRCFFTAPAAKDLRFCPRCGLDEVQAIAAADSAPIDLVAGKRNVQIRDRIALGSIASIYRCHFEADRKQYECVFKIARDARTNDLIVNEAEILRRLHNADADSRFAPFL